MKRVVKRRDLLKAGALAIWAPRLLKAQTGVTKLTNKLAVIDAGGELVEASWELLEGE